MALPSFLECCNVVWEDVLNLEVEVDPEVASMSSSQAENC